jgi:hypothetical protein
MMIVDYDVSLDRYPTPIDVAMLNLCISNGSRWTPPPIVGLQDFGRAFAINFEFCRCAAWMIRPHFLGRAIGCRALWVTNINIMLALAM